MRKMLSKQYITCLFVLVLALALEVSATDYKPIVLDPNYNHDKWETKPSDIIREFRAYTLSFDSKDKYVALGVPEWVAYEIKPYLQPLGAGPPRPGEWMTDSEEVLTAPGEGAAACMC